MEKLARCRTGTSGCLAMKVLMEGRMLRFKHGCMKDVEILVTITSSIKQEGGGFASWL
jgi:hypothetical protein